MNPRTLWGPAPSIDDFAAMAQNALDRLDEPFRALAQTVSIRVEEVADVETLEKLFIDDPYELTGLYSGVALTLELHSSPSGVPPVVWLYRLPILDEWMQTGDIALEDLVGHVLVHELGHHFGWSDDEMDRALGGD
ncbi:MAG: metallopeptidase family protein [Alphaproteobacteria bacterium]|nr:metallopeptidase family protein [Alphaproteobacteria bacterium]